MIREVRARGLGLQAPGRYGFMVVFAELDRQEAIRTVLREFLHVPVKFDREGSSVIYSDEPGMTWSTSTKCGMARG